MRSITEEQAYAAMFHFLEAFYRRGNSESEEVSNLLSWMSVLPDGGSADPAMMYHWRRSVDFALKGGKAGPLVLTKSKD